MRSHARRTGGQHACGEKEGFLTVVNSPRMGVCAYTAHTQTVEVGEGDMDQTGASWNRVVPWLRNSRA
jgi:hypothetical protein